MKRLETAVHAPDKRGIGNLRSRLPMLQLRIPKGLTRSRPSPCRKRKLIGLVRSAPNYFYAE